MSLSTLSQQLNATQLHHVHHHWNAALHTTAMATCSVKQWTTITQVLSCTGETDWLRRHTCMLNCRYTTTSGEMNGSRLRWSIPLQWMTLLSGNQDSIYLEATRHSWITYGPIQGHSAPCQKKLGLAATDMCPCSKCQTMSHIVNSCPHYKPGGGLQRLHSADDIANEWLKTCGS